MIKLSEVVVEKGIFCRLMGGNWSEPYVQPLCTYELAEIGAALESALRMNRYMSGVEELERKLEGT